MHECRGFESPAARAAAAAAAAAAAKTVTIACRLWPSVVTGSTTSGRKRVYGSILPPNTPPWFLCPIADLLISTARLQHSPKIHYDAKQHAATCLESRMNVFPERDEKGGLKNDAQ